MPLWEENGKVYNQSTAILRMIGRRHGLYVTADSSEQENYLIDWAFETVADWWALPEYRKWFADSHEDEQAVTDAADVFVNKFHKQIANKLAERGDSAQFIAGDRLTIADFAVLSAYLTFAVAGKQCKPTLACKAKVEESPAVLAYIERVKAEIPQYMTDRAQYQYSI